MDHTFSTHPDIADCPNCGGHVALFKRDEWSSYYCKCTHCGQSSRLCPSIETAVASWNSLVKDYKEKLSKAHS